MVERRIDHARVVTANQMIAIDWESRIALQTRLLRYDRGDIVEYAFLAAGTTRPVELQGPARALLLQALTDWLDEVGVDDLPGDVFDLRTALIEDSLNGRFGD